MGDSTLSSWIGIAAQPSWTAAAVARTKYLALLSAAGGLEQEVKSREDLTTNPSERGFTKQGKKMVFSSNHLMDFEGHELWLKHAFGAVSSNKVGASLAYKHDFTLATAKLMETIELCLDSKSSVRPANMITAVEFSGNLFDQVNVSYEYLGRDEDPLAAPGSPTFPDDDPIVPVISASTLIKLTSNAHEVQTWKLRIEDPMRDDGFYIGNARTIKKPVRVAKRLVTGEVTLEADFSDADILALYAAYQGLTETTFQAIYVGNEIASEGFYDTFDLNCTRIVFTGKTPEIPGPGPVELTLPFKAFYDVSGSKDAATLSLTNEVVSV